MQIIMMICKYKMKLTTNLATTKRRDTEGGVEKVKEMLTSER